MIEKKQPAVKPVITVYPDGRVVVGAGSTIGEILKALDLARGAVLGIVLNPEAVDGAPETEVE